MLYADDCRERAIVSSSSQYFLNTSSLAVITVSLHLAVFAHQHHIPKVALFCIVLSLLPTPRRMIAMSSAGFLCVCPFDRLSAILFVLLTQTVGGCRLHRRQKWDPRRLPIIAIKCFVCPSPDICQVSLSTTGYK